MCSGSVVQPCRVRCRLLLVALFWSGAVGAVVCPSVIPFVGGCTLAVRTPGVPGVMVGMRRGCPSRGTWFGAGGCGDVFFGGGGGSSVLWCGRGCCGLLGVLFWSPWRWLWDVWVGDVVGWVWFDPTHLKGIG